jgi:hypothetical protein
MLVGPALQLPDKRVVAFFQRRQLPAPSLDLRVRAVPRAPAGDHGRHAVHLRVLAEEMRTAQERRIDVPDTHDRCAAAETVPLGWYAARADTPRIGGDKMDDKRKETLTKYIGDMRAVVTHTKTALSRQREEFKDRPPPVRILVLG